MTRYGFPLVPDFEGIAHAYCGTTVGACLGDLLPWLHRPHKEDLLRAFIVKSRELTNSTKHFPHSPVTLVADEIIDPCELLIALASPAFAST